jgi:hypothetical protein
MALVKGKQLKKLLIGYIQSSVTVTGLSFSVTSSITTSLVTGGYNGTTLSITPAADITHSGIIQTAPNNKVAVYKANGKHFYDTSGYEVYARIVQDTSSGTYKLNFYYTNSSGSEVAYTFGSATSIVFYFPYRFNIGDLPTDTFFDIKIGSLELTGVSTPTPTPQYFLEALTYNNGTMLISSLTNSPSPSTNVMLFVNGESFSAVSSTPAISVDVPSKTITWNATNAGFSLASTDDLIVTYTA